MQKYLAAVLVFSLGVVSAVLQVVVAAMLWEWFMVPHGLPKLGPWHIYGVILTIHLMKPNLGAATDPKGELDPVIRHLAVIAGVGITLGLGYLVATYAI